MPPAASRAGRVGLQGWPPADDHGHGGQEAQEERALLLPRRAEEALHPLPRWAVPGESSGARGVLRLVGSVARRRLWCQSSRRVRGLGLSGSDAVGLFTSPCFAPRIRARAPVPNLIHQVLNQLNTMHGTLRERLRASDSQSQRGITDDGGHLDFLERLSGIYGARCVPRRS